tara:strand:- start:2711 stop:3256 length:546 start_codon:yes stop_codon:yes gene_type:complete
MFYTGIIFFFGVHLIPLNTHLKKILKTRLGEGPYIGLFSLLSLVGLLLVIFGYESSSNFLYSTNINAFIYSKYIMFLSLTALIAANFPTYIKKYSKHPMSLGIAIWSILHLLTNSDTSSVILFSSFLIYAIVSVLIAELRNAIIKQSTPKIMFDVLSIILGGLLTMLAFNFHEYLSGVDLI